MQIVGVKSSAEAACGMQAAPLTACTRPLARTHSLKSGTHQPSLRMSPCPTWHNTFQCLDGNSPLLRAPQKQRGRLPWRANRSLVLKAAGPYLQLYRPVPVAVFLAHIKLQTALTPLMAPGHLVGILPHQSLVMAFLTGMGTGRPSLCWCVSPLHVLRSTRGGFAALYVLVPSVGSPWRQAGYEN